MRKIFRQKSRSKTSSSSVRTTTTKVYDQKSKSWIEKTSHSASFGGSTNISSSDRYLKPTDYISLAALVVMFICLVFNGSYESFQASKYMTSIKTLNTSNNYGVDITGYYDDNGSWVSNEIKTNNYDWTLKLQQLSLLKNPVSLVFLEQISEQYSVTDSEFITTFEKVYKLDMLQYQLVDATNLRFHWSKSSTYNRSILINTYGLTNSDCDKIDSWLTEPGWFQQSFADKYLYVHNEPIIVSDDITTYSSSVKFKKDFYSSNFTLTNSLSIVFSVVALPFSFLGSLFYDLGVVFTFISVW